MGRLLHITSQPLGQCSLRRRRANTQVVCTRYYKTEADWYSLGERAVSIPYDPCRDGAGCSSVGPLEAHWSGAELQVWFVALWSLGRVPCPIWAIAFSSGPWRWQCLPDLLRLTSEVNLVGYEQEGTLLIGTLPCLSVAAGLPYPSFSLNCWNISSDFMKLPS